MKKYFICISLLLLLGCKKKETGRGDFSEIFIDTKNITNREDISFLIESIDVLPLKETKGNFIGEAHKIIKTADHIIIFDRSIAKRIVVFDTQGNFIKNVITLGRGPGEAIQLNDFWLNSDGNLEIYDYSRKIIFTCNRDYDIIRETRVGGYIFTALKRIPSSSEFIGFKNYSEYNPPFKGEHYQVAFLDSGLQKINRIDHAYSEELNGILILEPINPFRIVNDSLRFSTCFNPFIYDVDLNKGLIERYKLVYSPNALPIDYETEIFLKERNNLLNYSKNFPTKDLVKGYSGYTGDFLETKQYLLITSFNTNYERFLSIYDKSETRVSAQAISFKSSAHQLKLLPNFQTTDETGSNLIVMLPGSLLDYFFEIDHPIMRNIKENIGTNYIVTLKFKL